MLIRSALSLVLRVFMPIGYVLMYCREANENTQ
jgi:hypothetical protein